MNSGQSGMGMSKHRKSGSTFKGRRTKMAMEREANKPKMKPIKPEMKSSILELYK